MRGQALVEFALVMPLLILTLLGFAEVGRGFAAAHGWQRGVDVLADAAAIRIALEPGESWHSGWQILADNEQVRTGCGEPDVTFPDDTSGPGDRVVVGWTCQHRLILLNGFSFPPMRIESVAVIPLAP